MNNEKKLFLRGNEIAAEHQANIHRRTDRMFAVLMILQWFACIAAAVWISPQTWTGGESSTNIHVWAAFLMGGIIASLPIWLAINRPGAALTRHVIAVAQMLFSALLIHLTGGRIETHFHVFGSLALLAAYRDWRVLLTSTLIVAIDHGVRGAIWPESVFGVLTAAPWRTIEHAAWVVFEDVFLFIIVRQSVSEMQNIGRQQAQLESMNHLMEEKVEHRTVELKRAEERLQLIIDSVPNGLLMIDESGDIQMTNPRAEEMFGYSTGELLGQSSEVLMPQRFLSYYPAMLDRFMNSPSKRVLGSGHDLLGFQKDGSEIPIELGLNSICTDDGAFILVSVVDITKRKNAELELQRYASQLESINHDLTQTKAELEQKNQELDEFTYVASHDLQEPVRKLISFSKLLEQDVGENLNEQAARDLKFIVEAASRMRNLVQALLALSRTGRAAMKNEKVCLRDCCDRAIESLQLRIEETQAKIMIADLPVIMGDRTMLTQLFQNLIANALKFTNDDVPEIKITAEKSDGKWLVGVKDNGIGMKPEHAERIFKPFQRLHRRDEYEGTGIGLSICKKTVERHHGRLWVDSNPGEGAHFKFNLPMQLERKECLTSEQNPTNELQSC